MLIGSNGEKLGSFSFEDAFGMAQKDNLDLVQVSPPSSEIVVCKIMDYGKHIFAKKKSTSSSKSKVKL